MSGILTRWPVVQRHDVTDEDLEADGVVRSEVVDRLIGAARLAYLERCRVVQELCRREDLVFAWQAEELARDDMTGRPETLIVSASIAEFRPTSFTVTVRVRPVGGDSDRPVNSRCARAPRGSGDARGARARKRCPRRIDRAGAGRAGVQLARVRARALSAPPTPTAMPIAAPPSPRARCWADMRS